MRKMLGILLATAMLSSPLYAQITSGILRGTVKDVTGGTIENANVTVVFIPTNQRIVTKTTTEGRFVLSNLKPGGPYSVSVTALGFRPKSTDNLTVRLGEATTADLEMEKIVVTLDQVSVIADVAAQARKDGVTAQLNHEKLQVLPTLSRSLQDMTRMTIGITTSRLTVRHRMTHLVSVNHQVNPRHQFQREHLVHSHEPNQFHLMLLNKYLWSSHHTM
jgi:hypothetical protein